MVSDSPDVVRGTAVSVAELGLSPTARSWIGKHWALVTFYWVGGCKMLSHYAVPQTKPPSFNHVWLSLLLFAEFIVMLSGEEQGKMDLSQLTWRGSTSACFIATFPCNKQCPCDYHEAHIPSFLSVGDCGSLYSRKPLGRWGSDP